jgi:hypothetical protein
MALGERAVTTATALVGSGQNRVPHLCIRALDEVTKDVEARGWWFQTSRGTIIGLSTAPQPPDWQAAHPEEFRRYVTIRAARILQTRYITDETLHKLTLEEEMYSKAVLEAKDAEEDSSVTFALPQDIENLGVRGVMFLQSNLEEKLATLKLGTELAQTELLKAQELKVDSEKLLIDAQELLVDQQKLTEIQETAKRTAEKDLVIAQDAKTDAEKNLLVSEKIKTDAEKSLINDQEALVTQQKLTEVQETAKRTSEKALIDAQELKTDAETELVKDQEALLTQQKLTEVQETLKRTAEKDLLVSQELKVDADTELVKDQEVLVAQQALTEIQQTTKVQKEALLITAQELKVDAEKLLVDEQTAKTTAEASLIADQEALVTQQALTEAQNTTKTQREAELLQAQELKVDAEKLLIDSQELKTDAETTLTTKQGLLVDAQELKTDAETTLVTAQELQVDAQTATEGSRKLDIEADTTLKGKQGALVDAQELKTDAETTLVTAQELKVDAETATEGSRKLDIEADTTLKGKQGALIDAQELKTDAETTLTTKQGLLVDAQELKTDAETTLTTKQGLLVDSQELKTDAETTLTTKQGALVDAQELKTDAEKLLVDEQTSKTTSEKALIDSQELKTDSEKLLVDAQTSLTADQELKTVSETALLDSQKTKLDAETAYMVTAEKNYFDNGGVAISGESGYFTYKDFRPEMRILGITEAQYQEYPAYKKEDLIKDAHKIRSDHTGNNVFRNSQEVSLNTHLVMDRGRDLDDFLKTQFYGESNSTINGNPITVPQREYFTGFNDTGALVAGTTDKHLADGNPKGYTLSTNIQNGLEEDGTTTFSDDNAGNTDAISYSNTTANRSFLSNFGVHVKRPQIDEIVTGRTFKVSMWVNFYQPSNDESSKYLLKVIGDNAVTVYLDGEQVGIKDYVPYRWEDANTLASYRFNWDRPQDIYLSNVTKGFHKLTFEYQNFTDVGSSSTARSLGGNTNQANPQYAGQYDNYHRVTNNGSYINENTNNITHATFSNAVTFAAQLFPIRQDSTSSTFNFFNTATSSSTLGADGTAFSIWDTVKQVGLGTYHEEDLEVVNDILRLIGEPPVNDFHTNALAIETFNLMRKTDTELQARGWDFNTEQNVFLGSDLARINKNDHVSTTSSVYKKAYIQVVDSDNILSFEANDYKTRLQRLLPDVTYKVLLNTETREIYDWFNTSKGVKGTAIVQRDLTDVPQKYKEYLTVRTALIITELYPKSGVDLQRLPKMEQELRSYFKDRENDQGNYNIFDNYDTNERIGFNRNYDLN